MGQLKIEAISIAEARSTKAKRSGTRRLAYRRNVGAGVWSLKDASRHSSQRSFPVRGAVCCGLCPSPGL